MNEAKKVPASVSGLAKGWLLGLFAALALASAWTAQATAPRISAGMFGEEKKVDILQYRLDQRDAAVEMEERLLAGIVAEAFKAGNKPVVLDVQPARQLAKYALFNGEVAAVIGSPTDFTAKEKKRYRFVTFYLRGGAAAGAEVALVFSHSHPAADDLYRAFASGMRQLLASGRYLDCWRPITARAGFPRTISMR